MTIYRKEKRIFKKGEKYHLDQMYTILGLLPHDGEDPYYQQDDIGDLDHYAHSKSRDGSENDCGEYIKILRNFTVSFSVIV